MDSFNQAKAAVAALLSENSSIGIIVSEHQTLDILAAALSLHLIFLDSGKNSQIISRKDPTVEHSFLVGIDQMKKQFGGVTKMLTVSFPYHDGDIEKVSYNIEGDKLNVNLFAEEQGISFEEKDIKYLREGSAPQLIFTVGVANPEALVGLTGSSSKIVNIDNNVANTLFGDAVLVDASFSSLSEIVAKLALEFSLQVEFDVAQNLLDGIVSATQNFMSPKTSPIAFEMIGVLLQKGAVRKNMKDNSRTTSDTSLSMLNKSQNKPFGQKPPFVDTQGKQPKPFPNNKPFVKNQPFEQSSQGKPFGSAQGGPFQNVQGNQFNQQVRQSFDSAQSKPQAPRPIPTFEDQAPVTPMPEDVFTPQSNNDMNANNIPTEDEAPSDWFVPKVFKSTKNQD
ncbi:MAG: bifunctional oligoribonuclease/PAP phosphatase NrnA [Candidatus Levyibacteriota bacterium]